MTYVDVDCMNKQTLILVYNRIFIKIDDYHLINNVVVLLFYIQICFDLFIVFGTKLIDSRNNLYNSLECRPCTQCMSTRSLH